MSGKDVQELKQQAKNLQASVRTNDDLDHIRIELQAVLAILDAILHALEDNQKLEVLAHLRKHLNENVQLPAEAKERKQSILVYERAISIAGWHEPLAE